MNARFIKLWNDLQSSYYFVPGLMAIAAIILALITGTIDRVYGYQVAEQLGWFYSARPDGARAILSTIAGSMMTVASVTFSITMVAVTSAAGQYGPRLVGNFMRDRGNQFTLGTFTATFIYCLLIMRLSRNAGTDGSDIAEHVPNLSLLVAIVLTLISVAVMIYFIHHIPETLNVGNITGRVGRKLRDALEDVFPENLGEGASDKGENFRDALSEYNEIVIKSTAEGYIQAVNEKALLEFATSKNYVLEFVSRPGDFVTRNTPLMKIYAHGKLSDNCDEKIRASFAMGLARTEHQNVLFLADELVEILARALSPGINDPFTAINCLHWYESALKAALSGNPSNAFRKDPDGNLRVIAYPITVEDLAETLLGGSQQYVLTDEKVTREMRTMIKRLIAVSSSEENRTTLKVYETNYSA